MHGSADWTERTHEIRLGRCGCEGRRPVLTTSLVKVDIPSSCAFAAQGLSISPGKDRSRSSNQSVPMRRGLENWPGRAGRGLFAGQSLARKHQPCRDNCGVRAPASGLPRAVAVRPARHTCRTRGTGVLDSASWGLLGLQGAGTPDRRQPSAGRHRFGKCCFGKRLLFLAVENCALFALARVARHCRAMIDRSGLASRDHCLGRHSRMVSRQERPCVESRG